MKSKADVIKTLSRSQPKRCSESFCQFWNDLTVLLAQLEYVERAFSTNPAHELRSPLPMSLAHRQNIKPSAKDSTVEKNMEHVETGLKKLVVTAINAPTVVGYILRSHRGCW
jgi:hypothetical protein